MTFDNDAAAGAGLTCPGCTAPMRAESFERATTGELDIDVCYSCRAIWFDHMESTQLAPGSVIALFKNIHEHSADACQPLPVRLPCPRCREPLTLTNDIVKSGRVTYHRCGQNHGRLTSFLHFLREKQFVRDLNAKELESIKARVAEVRCSGCGGPVDIKTDTACSYCHAPLSVLDADAVEKALKAYGDKQAGRNEPARAAAPSGAFAVQPALAPVRAHARTFSPATDESWSGSDLVLGGIALLVSALAE
jgi:Zn-finger nucleic acid-binding protein